jgi:hypothetical protein
MSPSATMHTQCHHDDHVLDEPRTGGFSRPTNTWWIHSTSCPPCREGSATVAVQEILYMCIYTYIYIRLQDHRTERS